MSESHPAMTSSREKGVWSTSGYLMFVVFLALGLVTLSYRNVANRHAHKAEAYAKAHPVDQAQVGHGHH